MQVLKEQYRVFTVKIKNDMINIRSKIKEYRQFEEELDFEQSSNMLNLCVPKFSKNMLNN